MIREGHEGGLYAASTSVQGAKKQVSLLPDDKGHQSIFFVVFVLFVDQKDTYVGFH